MSEVNFDDFGCVLWGATASAIKHAYTTSALQGLS